MSGALSLIRDYGDISSEDSDSESEKVLQKKPTLPPPNLDKVLTVPAEEHQDNPTAHNGRIRSFPHVRGNWASFVYVNYACNEEIFQLINKIKTLVMPIDETCLICDDIHLSLSRTIVLQYHLISTFTKGLQKALANVKSFSLYFDSVEVYCNDEKTRTFIALKADCSSKQILLNISKKVDKVLSELKLPPFYKNPSFHSSILWVNGNKKSELEEILDKLDIILHREIEENPKPLLIDKVHWKIGNKYYQYCLSGHK